MTDLAILMSFLIVVGGVASLVAPRASLRLVPRNPGLGFLAFASGGRIVMGLALFFGGMTAPWPDFVQIAGFFVGLAGLAIPFLGVARLKRIIDWAVDLSPTLMRFIGLLAAAFGVALLRGLGVFGA